MSNRFAIVTADTVAPLKIFDGATGEVIDEYSPPAQLVSNSGYNCRVKMSYDGNIVAIHSTLNYLKVWIVNLATGHESTVDLDSISLNIGFDGQGVLYVGLYDKYLKIAPPYASAETIFPGKAIEIVTCQKSQSSIASLRNTETGEGGYYQYDLTTGEAGSETGIPNAYEIDTQSSVVFGLLDGAGYGARQWDYSTGAALAQIGPTRGDGEGRSRVVGFTSDGLSYVMKTGPNTMGKGRVGQGTTIVPMDSVLPLSGDNSAMIFEGLLDDSTALLSQAAFPRTLLVAFNVVTGQVVWSNNNGNNQGDSFSSECARAGVQLTLGPGGNPPEPVGFWKDLLLAYQTA